MANTQEYASPVLPLCGPHTAGTWKVARPVIYGEREIIAPLRLGSEDPAVVVARLQGNPKGELEHNARLIAAAPQLLEVLLAIVKECADPASPFYTPEPPFGGDSYLPREFIDAAEVALGKALGKEVA